MNIKLLFIGVVILLCIYTVIITISEYSHKSYIQEKAKDRWTETDMQRWTQQFREHNPGIKVPEAIHVD